MQTVEQDRPRPNRGALTFIKKRSLIQYPGDLPSGRPMALRSRSRDRIAFFGGNSALSPRKKSLNEKGLMRPISTDIESLPHESLAVKSGRNSAVETFQTVLTACSLPAEAFGVASLLPISLGKAWGEKFPSLVGRGKASAVRAHGTRICHLPGRSRTGRVRAPCPRLWGRVQSTKVPTISCHLLALACFAVYTKLDGKLAFWFTRARLAMAL
jgi:hypothetical protein